MEKLNQSQLEKYYCSTFLKEIGIEGQLRLLNSRVLVIGAGGLGSSTLMYLSSSGVGHIGIVDSDIVSLSNLPRQIIYRYKDVGKAKVTVSKKRMLELNPDIEVTTYKRRATKANIKKLIQDYDIVIDCTDNFESKFLIDDACVKLNKPLVTAGVSDFQGQVNTFVPHLSKDFKSIFSALPINIDQKYIDEDQGVFPPVVGIISDIATSEALKYLLGIGELLLNQVLVFNAKKNEFHKIKFPE